MIVPHRQMHHRARRPFRPLRFAGLFVFLLGAFGILGSGVAAASPRVVVLPTTGIVDNVMSGYLREGIARAARDGAAAVIIQLDTPGGSLEATREITKSILEAPLPVIVWVAPAGSRAASAGTFITLAANVAVMAPATNIGAASPVGGQGEDIPGTLGEKVLNDTIATITSIATERGRNVEKAVSTVKDAASFPVDEAIANGLVDGKADSLAAVLAFATGRTTKVGGQTVTIDLTGATTDQVQMNVLQSFLHLLTDPNIAFILFTVGFYGMIYEVIHPNFATGVIGAIAIILAFIGFGSLPLNVGGLLLIGLAIILFVLELTVTSHGLLTIAGLVCFVLGAGALYTEPGPGAPDVSVAWPIIAIMTIATGAFMTVVVVAAIKSHRMIRMPFGLAIGGGMLPLGINAEVRRPLDPQGSVYAAGEEWSARSADERRLERGTPVRVVRQDGLTLIVETIDPAISAAQV
jgi:membrane-bound serine protease (ClpP class)